MQLGFYLVGTMPLERALAKIAAQVLKSGERLVVVAEDAKLRARLDEALWAEEPAQFLAHGAADDAEAARQPIVLGADCAAPNGARHIALADGRWRDEAAAFDRAFLFFDEDGRQAARDTWRALEDREGLERAFYAQEDGRWVKKG